MPPSSRLRAGLSPLLLAVTIASGCDHASTPETGSDAGTHPGGGTDGGGGTDAGGGTPSPPPGEPIPDGGTATSAPRYEHYIRRQPYPKMVIEVDGWGNYTPTASVVTRLQKGLLSVLDKESVEITMNEKFPGKGSDHAWTNDELYSLAQSTTNLAVPVGTVEMHVMLVDGHSVMDTADGKILGLAFPWTHLVLFRQTMDSVCSGSIIPGACAQTEFGVWSHETGHQLGLVDNGLAMVGTSHKDAAHGAHDSSDKCAMYWAYEGSGITDAIGSGLFGGDTANLGLDAACMADLNAVKTRP